MASLPVGHQGMEAIVAGIASINVSDPSPGASASAPSADNVISINHADCKDDTVPRVTIVESLLTDKNVVIVGEGNFTFTVALAAIRNSWSGIVSTRYEPVDDFNPKPEFDTVKQECLEFCRKNHQGNLRSKGIAYDDATVDNYIQAIKAVQQPSLGEEWLFGIDATATPDNLAIRGKVVIFQCPWIPQGPWPETPATLIASFLSHMSTKQNKGDYVLIGITTRFPYVKSYKLEDLLGVGLSRGKDSSSMYDFLGADDTFIVEILKHGYHHISCRSDKDIHEDIITFHITLVFRRNDATLPQPPVVPQPNI